MSGGTSTGPQPPSVPTARGAPGDVDLEAARVTAAGAERVARIDAAARVAVAEAERDATVDAAAAAASGQVRTACVQFILGPLALGAGLVLTAGAAALLGIRLPGA